MDQICFDSDMVVARISHLKLHASHLDLVFQTPLRLVSSG